LQFYLIGFFVVCNLLSEYFVLGMNLKIKPRKRNLVFKCSLNF
jgi:hypothetical protein